MRVPSSLLKEVLKQAAVEVGKTAGSEIKDGIKEAASEKGKKAGKQWTETVIDEAKNIGQDEEHIMSTEESIRTLREKEMELPDESEIDWTKEQLSQLSDQEFTQLVLEQEKAEVLGDNELKIADIVALDEKEPHTNYLITIEDLEEKVEYDIFHTLTRHNSDLIEGTPDILANSVFDYIKMYNIEPEGIVVATQESVNEYFQLEALSKYMIFIDDENSIRRSAYKYDIERSDLK